MTDNQQSLQGFESVLDGTSDYNENSSALTHLARSFDFPVTGTAFTRAVIAMLVKSSPDQRLAVLRGQATISCNDEQATS